MRTHGSESGYGWMWPRREHKIEHKSELFVFSISMKISKQNFEAISLTDDLHLGSFQFIQFLSSYNCSSESSF
jgi:hypothetical protein